MALRPQLSLSLPFHIIWYSIYCNTLQNHTILYNKIQHFFHLSIVNFHEAFLTEIKNIHIIPN